MSEVVFHDLSSLTLKRVLSDNAKTKTIFLEGEFKGKVGKSVVILEKTAFSTDKLPFLFTEKSTLKQECANDIYVNYSCLVDPVYNDLKTTIIYPATEKHIAKYESKPVYLIEESPENYKSITLPCLKEKLDLQWVYNILEHKKEAERIIFEDSDNKTGFILLPDLKWDGKALENFYCLAIVHTKEIKSLRDLNGTHIPLLRNILDKGLNVILDKYHIPKSQLRIYVHYQPSYYHFHVHFSYLRYEAPGIFAEKSHLLSTVINNLELKSNYYQEATIPFVVGELHFLFEAYRNAGLISAFELPKTEEAK